MGGIGVRARKVVARRLRTGLAVPEQLPDADHVVALTFDDGPDPVFTPLVLDVLAENGVPATFFCVGENVREHPDLVARMAEEGHVVGSHSDTHRVPPGLGFGDLLRDYRSGRNAVEAIVGRPARLFRPPQGVINGWSALAVRAAGLRPWLWSIDTEDWRPGVEAESIVGEASHAGPGDVLLFHDGLAGPLEPVAGDRSATLVALPAIIDSARSRGLDFVVLPG